MAEFRGLDLYEEGVVHGNMAQVLDAISNLEALL